MTGLLKSCIECGEVSDGPRCMEHRPKRELRFGRNRRHQGYDAAWDKTSARARRIQPWCTDCGATDDLTADHSPEAWARKAEGKAITLDLITVVCRACNSRRGKIRGDSKTWGEGVEAPVPSPPGKAKFLTDTPRGYGRMEA